MKATIACLPCFVTRLHCILKEVAGVKVPFAELREGCNRAGVAIAARLQKVILANALGAGVDIAASWDMPKAVA